MILPLENFEQLISFAVDYHKTHPEFFGSLNVAKVTQRLAKALVTHPTFIIRQNSKLVGALVLDEIPGPWWGDDPYLTDLFFYIAPEARNFKNARQLLKEADDYAKIEGKRLEITLFNPEDPERKGVLMKRLGFKPVGGLYEGGVI